ncbi:MAG: hypothetical protein LC659_15225, partial [Myxococcales bacterium]|nr:hypothetical protein [Myxococcales bacterium]
MRTLAFIFVVAASCSYTFDTSEPTLPYVGAETYASSLPRLNSAPVDGEAFALGADKRIWLLLQHTDATWEMQPMSGDKASDTIAPSEQMQLVTWRALYITRRPTTDGGAPPD